MTIKPIKERPREMAPAIKLITRSTKKTYEVFIANIKQGCFMSIVTKAFEQIILSINLHKLM